MKKNLIIAEIGQNHDGSLGLAHSYIDAVASTGADVIKFQMHFADEESTLNDKFRKKFSYKKESRFEYWKRMEFSNDEWFGLIKHAKKKKLLFSCSPFSLKAVELLKKLNVDIWKIASGEINNFEILNKIIKQNKPIIISTGLSNYLEIKKTIGFLNKKKFNNFILMQCTTKYPCDYKSVGINNLDVYKKKFKCDVGLSDHTGSIFPSLYALSKGISALEVHVTFDKEMFGPDIKSSISIEDLKKIVEYRNAKNLMDKNPINKDKFAKKVKYNKKLFSKSLSIKKNMVKGEILEKSNLVLKKPGTGLDYTYSKKLIGRKAKKNINKNYLIFLKDFE